MASPEEALSTLGLSRSLTFRSFLNTNFRESHEETIDLTKLHQVDLILEHLENHQIF